MRIISQDGKVNVPYETSRIEYNGYSRIKINEIGERVPGDVMHKVYVNGEVFAQYSTREKALEVLEEIKQKGHFLGTGNNWYQMPEDEEKENEEN